MNHSTMLSRLIAAGALAGMLLGVGQSAHPSQAAAPAAPLSLSVPADIIVPAPSSDGTSVFYGEGTPDPIVPSDPAATVSCDIPSGSFFDRGETVVTCTATLGDQTARGAFSVLVAYDNDIDVELLLAQSPEGGILASTTVSYAMIVQNNGPLPADQAIVEMTLPAQLEMLQYPKERCSYTVATRKLRCTISNITIGAMYRKTADILVRVKKGSTGSFSLSASVSLARGQKDMKAVGNSASITTVIREISFGPNSVLLPQIQVP